MAKRSRRQARYPLHHLGTAAAQPPYVEQIVVNVPNLERIPQVADQIRDLLRIRHGINAGEGDDFFVRATRRRGDAAMQTPATVFALMRRSGGGADRRRLVIMN